MIHEIRCNCGYHVLLCKVIDGDIEVICRSKECRSRKNTKKRISIEKLLKLSQADAINHADERVTNGDSNDSTRTTDDTAGTTLERECSTE